MPDRYDVIVLGLGAMGSAAAHHLTEAGYDVLGLDRYHPPHPHGSSHGRTRIVRKAIFEHEGYVPWAARAYERWRQLEEETGRSILHVTGGLHLGTPEGSQVSGARGALDEHGMPYEQLSADAIRQRFSTFAPDDSHRAVLEPDAGFLLVHEAIEAHLEAAAAGGADLLFGSQAWGWAEHPTHVRVSTHDGRSYRADELVVAIGPWLPKHVPELDVGFEVERQVQFLVDPPDPLPSMGDDPEGLGPVFTYEPEHGRVFYGVHRPDGLVKVAIHHEGEVVDPDEVEGFVDQEDEARVRALLERYAPGLEGPIRGSMVCMYTNTPDRRFLLDRHPKGNRVVLVSPCSGHGFKYAPAIGEAVAQMVGGRDPGLSIELFGIERLLG